MAVKVNKEKCTGCSACKSACSMDAIEIIDGKVCINESCVECGACLAECASGALSL